MGNPISTPSPDTDIVSDPLYYWSFFPIKPDESDTFKGDDRSVTRILKNDFGDTEYQRIEIKKASASDYLDLQNDKLTTYYKIELSRSSNSNRTNLHDDCLVGSFYVQGGKYFEIIGQEGGNIIDVSKDDISKTAKLDPLSSPEYIIPQDFAWKTVEWYMVRTSISGNLNSSLGSSKRIKFFNGKIIAINRPKKAIKVEVEGENDATVSNLGYYDNGVRKSISFFKRFTENYAHSSSANPLYKKFRGWYCYNGDGDSYAVKDIKIEKKRTDLTDSEGSLAQYKIIISFYEDPKAFSVNDTTYCLFGKTPYPVKGVFQGSYLANIEQIDPGRGDPNNKLCLDGFWVSPRFDIRIPDGTRFGLCGGRYWGLGERAIDNNNAIVFMRTPKFGIGISSLLHSLSNINYLGFYDNFNNELSIRSGNLQYTEYPRKFSVSVGFPSKVETTFTTRSLSAKNISLPLNKDQDRTKRISFLHPPGESIMLFSIKDAGNYYGTSISGSGEMKLIGFEKTSTPQNKSLYKYRGQEVSPVYEYTHGDYHLYDPRDIYISANTEDSPIIINNKYPVAMPDTVDISYVEKNQLFTNSNFFDIVKTGYDEFIIVMGQPFPAFTVSKSPSESHSTGAGNRWEINEGIFIVGSRDQLTSWGTPGESFKKDSDLGVLALDSATHLCSLFDEIGNRLMIFFVSSVSKQVYLGLMMIPMAQINKDLLKCTSSADFRDFFWRPPRTSSYTANVVDGFTYKPTDEAEDRIITIASESLAEAQVRSKDVTDFGNAYCSYVSDGRMILTYDSLNGVNFIFSTSNGNYWESSEIILARNSTSGFFLEPFLFFIAPSGLFVKNLTSATLNQCMEAVEGSDATFIEKVQKTLDEDNPVYLDTGEIPSQRVYASYNDYEVIQVFYYNSEGFVDSVSGTKNSWFKSNNF